MSEREQAVRGNFSMRTVTVLINLIGFNDIYRKDI